MQSDVQNKVTDKKVASTRREPDM